MVVATPVHVPPERASICPLVPAKSDEVAMEAASPVAPVMLPRTEFAATCARFANGRSPVIASVSERSSAPQAYVDAPVTRNICPTVEESVIAVKAEVPLPCKRPVKVEAPVPPCATVRSLVRVRVPIVPNVEEALTEEIAVEEA